MTFVNLPFIICKLPHDNKFLIVEGVFAGSLHEIYEVLFRLHINLYWVYLMFPATNS
jgi:hypothetical protein